MLVNRNKILWGFNSFICKKNSLVGLFSDNATN